MRHLLSILLLVACDNNDKGTKTKSPDDGIVYIDSYYGDEFGEPAAPVPEPGTLLIFTVGLGGLAAARARARRTRHNLHGSSWNSSEGSHRPASEEDQVDRT